MLLDFIKRKKPAAQEKTGTAFLDLYGKEPVQLTRYIIDDGKIEVEELTAFQGNFPIFNIHFVTKEENSEGSGLRALGPLGIAPRRGGEINSLQATILLKGNKEETYEEAKRIYKDYLNDRNLAVQNLIKKYTEDVEMYETIFDKNQKEPAQ